MRNGLLVLFCVLFIVLSATPSFARDTEFRFYYQRIEEVIDLSDTDDSDSWWQKTKSFVNRGVNRVKSYVERNITRLHFPGEGEKSWHSREDSDVLYRMKRTRVKSEEHLLQLMGAENESELSDGQKAMLAVYRKSSSQAIKDRLPYSRKSHLNIMLSDTTGFENASEYPHVTRDFWPFSHGPLINMSTNGYNYPGSSDRAKSTFLHEFAHSFDPTIPEFINPYGKDGTHYVNEKLGQRMALIEGWAIYNEMLESERRASQVINTVQTIRIESKDEAGKYSFHPAQELTGEQLMRVEGIIAQAMYRMSNEIEDGRKKVFESFRKTRWNVFRNFSVITRNFAKHNPEDIHTMARILDEITYGGLSDSEMRRFIGRCKVARAYINQRHQQSEVCEEDTYEEYASDCEAQEDATTRDVEGLDPHCPFTVH